MGNTGVSRLEEIASLRVQAQRLYRSGMERSRILEVMRITKGQLTNFLIGMPANDVRAAVPKMIAPLPVKQVADPATFVSTAKFCAPCRRRVLPSEVRSCPNACAMKRLARMS